MNNHLFGKPDALYVILFNRYAHTTGPCLTSLIDMQTIYRELNIDRLESFFRGRDCGFLCIVQGHISDLIYLYIFIAILKLPAIVLHEVGAFWVHFEVLGCQELSAECLYEMNVDIRHDCNDSFLRSATMLIEEFACALWNNQQRLT